MANKNFLYFLICLLLLSCNYKRVPRYLKSQFKYGTPGYAVSGHQLRFDGYYRDYKPIYESNSMYPCKQFFVSESDTSIKDGFAVSDVMFFPNGLCLVTYLGRINKSLDSLVFRKTINASRSKSKPGYISIATHSYWGPYEVFHDTVNIKVISPAGINEPVVGAFEQRYVIINESTLRPIYFRGLSKDCCPYFADCIFRLDSSKTHKTKFFLVDEIKVDPDKSWIIKKKWFWKNKDAFRRWKKKNG